MDLESIMLTEMSDREIHITYDLSYMWNLKKKKAHRYRKQMVTARGRGWG